MSEDQTVSVSFSKPCPIFPLGHVAVMPQQVLPLHIFEPRYRQMVQRVLDRSGQIAMAVFKGSRWKLEYHGRPPIMPAVCVAQIVQHERLPDGRYNILLQGVCRAKISAEMPPEAATDEDRDGQDSTLYREAMLEPVGILSDVEAASAEERLTPLRAHVQASLAEGPLRRLRSSDRMLEFTRNTDVPTTAILEVLSVAVVDDPRLRYRLLAEGDPERRAAIVEAELGRLERLIRLSEPQISHQAPKGCNWN